MAAAYFAAVWLGGVAQTGGAGLPGEPSGQALLQSALLPFGWSRVRHGGGQGPELLRGLKGGCENFLRRLVR